MGICRKALPQPNSKIEEGLSNLRNNVQELGNLLWNIVYNQKPLERCLTILGIDFTDTRSLFDPDRINLNNV